MRIWTYISKARIDAIAGIVLEFQRNATPIISVSVAVIATFMVSNPISVFKVTQRYFKIIFEIFGLTIATFSCAVFIPVGILFCFTKKINPDPFNNLNLNYESPSKNLIDEREQENQTKMTELTNSGILNNLDHDSCTSTGDLGTKIIHPRIKNIDDGASDLSLRITNRSEINYFNTIKELFIRIILLFQTLSLTFGLVNKIIGQCAWDKNRPNFYTRFLLSNNTPTMNTSKSQLYMFIQNMYMAFVYFTGVFASLLHSQERRGQNVKILRLEALLYLLTWLLPSVLYIGMLLYHLNYAHTFSLNLKSPDKSTLDFFKCHSLASHLLVIPNGVLHISPSKLEMLVTLLLQPLLLISAWIILVNPCKANFRLNIVRKLANLFFGGF